MKSPDVLCIDVLRGLAMDGPQRASSGHPGTAMALAPLGWVLFSKVMKHNPASPGWADRDRFILSCGHASMLHYGLLHLTGYDLGLDDLKAFRQWGSRTPGHPERGHAPGIELTTGPLGQGLSSAVGMALAERFLAARFNRPGHSIVDHFTYVFASDGDLMEGVASEASSLAGHLGLGRLILVYDDNRITIGGTTGISFTEDRDARYRAYGWHVQRLEDPNDLAAFEAALEAARQDPRPSYIAVRTIIAWPAPEAQDTPESHGTPLGAAEIRRTRALLGHPEDQDFYLPEAALEAGLEVRRRGEAAEADWQVRFQAWREAFPALAGEWDLWMEGGLPEGWDADLPRFEPGKAVATRVSSGKVINALAGRVLNLLGGSADLEPSTKTLIEGGPSQAVDHPEGRNVHYGIREHAMAAILNGAAAHGGVRPFGATFLVFSDYMRGALRLSALMGLPVIHVWTHDSIGLGEDGPTHQPVEHLPALRCLPNLLVLRPCDAAETAEAWRAALLHRAGPVGLVLTRQNVMTLDRTRLGPAAGLHRGAYTLAEAEGGAPRVLLLGTGSEVHLCLEARDRLQARGIPTRVVSMPSWELFAAQDPGYRDEILPPSVKARVSVEAASTFGWSRWVGEAGVSIGLDGFGASAPYEQLMESFGFHPEHVVEQALRLLP